MPNKYSKQLIIQARADHTITSGSKKISDKAANGGLECETVDFPIQGEPGFPNKRYKLTAALSKLDKNSRIYIRGHGNWKNQTVGGVDAQTWADTLIEAGMPSVKIVSVCACRAALDLGSDFANVNSAGYVDADQARAAHSADSFASKFHARLKTGGVKVPIYARTYKVVTRSTLVKHTSDTKESGPGTGSRVHKRSFSKILFDWQGNDQIRKWVSYSESDPESWTPV